MGKKQISEEALIKACNKIDSEYYGCAICPLRKNCVQNGCFDDTVSDERIEAFFNVAENLDIYIDEYSEAEAEIEEREQREYNEWIGELNRGYFRDRGI